MFGAASRIWLLGCLALNKWINANKHNPMKTRVWNLNRCEQFTMIRLHDHCSTDKKATSVTYNGELEATNDDTATDCTKQRRRYNEDTCRQTKWPRIYSTHTRTHAHGTTLWHSSWFSHTVSDFSYNCCSDTNWYCFVPTYQLFYEMRSWAKRACMDNSIGIP